MKKYATLVWKLIFAFATMFLCVFYAYIARSSWFWIMFCWFTFYCCLQVYFVGNNQFMMEVADPDVKGVIGGCIQTFRETGFAVGTATANLIHDVYMDAYWNGPIPGRDDSNFEDYGKIYLDDFFITQLIIVCVYGAFAFVLTFFSGFGVHEKDRGCYYVDLCKKKKGEQYEKVGENEPYVDS